MQNNTTPIYGMIQAMTSVASEKPGDRAAERGGDGPRFVNPPRLFGSRR